MTYTATIRHHSVSRARHITVEGTLTEAKRAASREFGADHQDYRIVIESGDDVVAWRRIGDREWHDCR